MKKFLNIAWLIAITTSWISFAVATWFWADKPYDYGLLMLMIIWFVVSLVLFLVGYRLRNQ